MTGFERRHISQACCKDKTAGLRPWALKPRTITNQVPFEGMQSVQVNGALLQEFDGFFFGSYARELSFNPVKERMPVVILAAQVLMTGFEPTCGNGLGLTGQTRGMLVPNALLGVQDQGGNLVSYLSNYDGVAVAGLLMSQVRGHRCAPSSDYETETVRGFFNDTPMGEIPFHNGHWRSDTLHQSVAWLVNADPRCELFH